MEGGMELRSLLDQVGIDLTKVEENNSIESDKLKEVLDNPNTMEKFGLNLGQKRRLMDWAANRAGVKPSVSSYAQSRQWSFPSQPTFQAQSSASATSSAQGKAPLSSPALSSTTPVFVPGVGLQYQNGNPASKSVPSSPAFGPLNSAVGRDLSSELALPPSLAKGNIPAPSSFQSSTLGPISAGSLKPIGTGSLIQSPQLTAQGNEVKAGDTGHGLIGHNNADSGTSATQAKNGSPVNDLFAQEIQPGQAMQDQATTPSLNDSMDDTAALIAAAGFCLAPTDSSVNHFDQLQLGGNFFTPSVSFEQPKTSQGGSSLLNDDSSSGPLSSNGMLGGGVGGGLGGGMGLGLGLGLGGVGISMGGSGSDAVSMGSASLGSAALSAGSGSAPSLGGLGAPAGGSLGDASKAHAPATAAGRNMPPTQQQSAGIYAASLQQKQLQQQQQLQQIQQQQQQLAQGYQQGQNALQRKGPGGQPTDMFAQPAKFSPYTGPQAAPRLPGGGGGGGGGLTGPGGFMLPQPQHLQSPAQQLLAQSHPHLVNIGQQASGAGAAGGNAAARGGNGGAGGNSGGPMGSLGGGPGSQKGLGLPVTTGGGPGGPGARGWNPNMPQQQQHAPKTTQQFLPTHLQQYQQKPTQQQQQQGQLSHTHDRDGDGHGGAGHGGPGSAPLISAHQAAQLMSINEMLQQEKEMLEMMLKGAQREAQEFAHQLGACVESMRNDKELLNAHKMAQASADKEVKFLRAELAAMKAQLGAQSKAQSSADAQLARTRNQSRQLQEELEQAHACINSLREEIRAINRVMSYDAGRSGFDGSLMPSAGLSYDKGRAIALSSAANPAALAPPSYAISRAQGLQSQNLHTAKRPSIAYSASASGDRHSDHADSQAPGPGGNGPDYRGGSGGMSLGGLGGDDARDADGTGPPGFADDGMGHLGGHLGGHSLHDEHQQWQQEQRGDDVWSEQGSDEDRDYGFSGESRGQQQQQEYYYDDEEEDQEDVGAYDDREDDQASSHSSSAAGSNGGFKLSDFTVSRQLMDRGGGSGGGGGGNSDRSGDRNRSASAGPAPAPAQGSAPGNTAVSKRQQLKQQKQQQQEAAAELDKEDDFNVGPIVSNVLRHGAKLKGRKGETSASATAATASALQALSITPKSVVLQSQQQQQKEPRAKKGQGQDSRGHHDKIQQAHDNADDDEREPPSAATNTNRKQSNDKGGKGNRASSSQANSAQEAASHAASEAAAAAVAAASSDPPPTEKQPKNKKAARNKANDGKAEQADDRGHKSHVEEQQQHHSRAASVAHSDAVDDTSVTVAATKQTKQSKQKASAAAASAPVVAETGPTDKPTRKQKAKQQAATQQQSDEAPNSPPETDRGGVADYEADDLPQPPTKRRGPPAKKGANPIQVDHDQGHADSFSAPAFASGEGDGTPLSPRSAGGDNDYDSQDSGGDGSGARPLCKFWRNGQCRYGTKCTKSHENPNKSNRGGGNGGTGKTANRKSEGGGKKGKDGTSSPDAAAVLSSVIGSPFDGPEPGEVD